MFYSRPEEHRECAASLAWSLAQPKATLESRDLYPTLIEKAAALGFSLIQNHAFVDGNKRVAHAVMETFLVLTGNEIGASTEEQERLILELAAGQVSRDSLEAWLRRNVRPRPWPMPSGAHLPACRRCRQRLSAVASGP